MKSDKWATYKELELIPDSVVDPTIPLSRFSAWVRHAWSVFLDAIASHNSIHIWKKTDGIGHTWWYVYDPATNMTHAFTSEHEVRIWLESRYYRAESRPNTTDFGRIWH